MPHAARRPPVVLPSARPTTYALEPTPKPEPAPTVTATPQADEDAYPEIQIGADSSDEIA